MPFRPQPMDALLPGPSRYPEPDWEAIGTVARVWVPDDETVGWLILQGEGLAWISASSPEDLGHAICLHVLELIGLCLARDLSAVTAWEAILRTTLHVTPEDLYLPAFLGDLHAGALDVP